MPSVSAHMAVAGEVARRLGLNSDDFIRGNLLPDIIDVANSHHKVESGAYMVPDIDYFIENMEIIGDLKLGYLTHLLLDKHYLEDYLGKIYPGRNIFLDGKIYMDYDYLSYPLAERFGLDVERLGEILAKYNCKISEEKLKYNIECLKRKKVGVTNYLDFESFARFLLEISKTISKELVNYASKSGKLRICIG